jgi:alkanesulfonate monooxygenase SsuD/methylene tetrahydromethanopterin reductase-like flavin-dependent oxidoreductase (luciferase family)
MSWCRPRWWADDTATARHLASSYGHWVYSIRACDGAIPYPNPDTVEPLTDGQLAVVKDRTATQFVGDPDEVADKLETLQRVTAADELVITSVTHRHADRLRSHELIAKLGALRMNTREGKHRKPIHLAAHFPGVNNTTVWADPEAGSQIEFDSFVHLAQTAERGLFDFFFLAEGLRLREHRGRIHDLDVVGRPDTFAVLAALAGVTAGWGWPAPSTPRSTTPDGTAIRTLDQLSDGLRRWNMVTLWTFTGENFRRGGFLDHPTASCRGIHSWRASSGTAGPDAVVADRDRVYVDPSRIRRSSTTARS